jgi:hypothetical protein
MSPLEFRFSVPARKELSTLHGFDQHNSPLCLHAKPESPIARVVPDGTDVQLEQCNGLWNQQFIVDTNNKPHDETFVTFVDTSLDNLTLTDGCKIYAEAIRSEPYVNADDGLVHFNIKTTPPNPGAVLKRVRLGFKYNIGYCGNPGGAGFKLQIGNNVIFDSGQLTEPPFDTACGGNPHAYFEDRVHINQLDLYLDGPTEVLINFTSTGRNMEVRASEGEGSKP